MAEPSRTAAGASLVELLVALSILLVGVVALVQLFTYTARANAHARRITGVTALAAQKLDQLRSLAWTYDAGGLPVGDSTSDLSVTPERPTGGRGLAPSPPATLDVNTAGYVDFLDAQGRTLGVAASAPPGTAFVRRWAVWSPAFDPFDSLLVQVRVQATAAVGRASEPAVVTLTTVRSRVTW